jgi:hypothetical protein
MARRSNPYRLILHHKTDNSEQLIRRFIEPQARLPIEHEGEKIINRLIQVARDMIGGAADILKRRPRTKTST